MILPELNVRLNDALVVFLTGLRTCWQSMAALSEKLDGENVEDLISDWAQANWEMIVEAALSVDLQVFIEPYGDGADCNPVGSRVWMPGVTSTHAVHCVPRSANTVTDVLLGQQVLFPVSGLLFDRFAARTEGGWYAEHPPFDHALVFVDGQESLFPLTEVRFILKKIE